MMSSALPEHWLVQTSKRTGRSYWFNSKTNESTYDEPPELRRAIVIDGAATSAVALAPKQSEYAPSDQYTDDEQRGISSEDMVAYRDAVESVCSKLHALISTTDTSIRKDGDAAWQCDRIRRFPSHDWTHRTAIIGMAEEYGLYSFVAHDNASGDKSVLVYVPVRVSSRVLLEQEQGRLCFFNYDITLRAVLNRASCRQKSRRLSGLRRRLPLKHRLADMQKPQLP
jgi:hypothetical protein